jgi:hypothetical protein
MTRAADAPQAGPKLADLSFMTGCWKGTFQSRSGDGIIEEHYTAASENMILGTTRYLRDGRTVQYEFLLIQSDSSGIFMRPFPNGRRSEHDFRMTQVQDERAVFEAPEHDFPKRIAYARSPHGTLVAQIDGGPGDPNPRTWEMSAGRCY